MARAGFGRRERNSYHSTAKMIYTDQRPYLCIICYNIIIIVYIVLLDFAMEGRVPTFFPRTFVLYYYTVDVTRTAVDRVQRWCMWRGYRTTKMVSYMIVRHNIMIIIQFPNGPSRKTVLSTVIETDFAIIIYSERIFRGNIIFYLMDVFESDAHVKHYEDLYWSWTSQSVIF